MTRVALPLLGLALVAASARAGVWEDPSLDEALRQAEMVVRVRAPAEGSQGQARVRFTIERVLHGRPPPAALEVGGFHDPAVVPGPTFRPGEVLYLILVRGEDGGLQVPTPTFGRFPVEGDQVHYAVLRDTFLRVTLSVEDFERYLALLLDAPDAGWLAGLRAHLREGAPADEGPARMRHYLALEALARVGGPDDAAFVRPFLDAQAAPFQMRVSACRALARCGPVAGDDLLRAAGADPERAVRTAAIGALVRLDPPLPALRARLLELLPEASAEPVRFAGPRDPRLGRWPSPKVAILEALAQLDPAEIKPQLLAALDGAERLEVVSAALRALVLLTEDPALPHELVARFRPAGAAESRIVNDELCAALTRLTGRDHGPDVDAWRAWSAAAAQRD